MVDIFFGTRGPRTSRILVVGEAWGAQEANKRAAFVGPSGAEIERMLGSAGIDPTTCLFTNIIARQPAMNEFSNFLNPGRKGANYRGVYPQPELVREIERLRSLIRHVKPSIVIGCGNWPLWALTKHYDLHTVKGYRMPRGVQKMRGSQVYCDPCIETAETGVCSPPISNVVNRGLGSAPLIGGSARVVAKKSDRDQAANVMRDAARHNSTALIPFLPILHPAAVLREPKWSAATIQDLRRAKRFLDDPTSWQPLEPHYVATASYLSILRELDRLSTRADKQTLPLSVDIETHGGLLRTIAFADSPQRAVCVPFARLDDEGRFGTSNIWREGDFCVLGRRCRDLLLHPNVEVIGQNFLYDLAYISSYLGAVPRVRTDTMLAHHLCFPGTPKSLSYLASLYCDRYVYWKDDLKDSNDAGDEELAWRYNCEDAARTYEISGVLERTIEQMGLSEPWSFQKRYFWTCFRKNTRGIKVDLPARAKKTIELTAAIEDLRYWLASAVPEEWLNKKAKSPWYSSPKQTMEIFYERLQLRPILHRKTRRPTFDDTALKELRKRNPHLAVLFDKLESYRSSAVFIATFLSARLDPDSRMRCSFNLGGTSTFRLSSSSNPFGRGLNLQNIPTIESED